MCYTTEGMNTPFRCRGCRRGFKRDSDLTRHLRNVRDPRCLAVAREDLSFNTELPPVHEWGGDFFGNDYAEQDFPMTAAEAAALRHRPNNPRNSTNVETRAHSPATHPTPGPDLINPDATPSATTANAHTHETVCSQPRDSTMRYDSTSEEDDEDLRMPELEDISDSEDEGSDSDEESDVDDVVDGAAMAELVEKLRGISFDSTTCMLSISIFFLSLALTCNLLLSATSRF